MARSCTIISLPPSYRRWGGCHEARWPTRRMYERHGLQDVSSSLFFESSGLVPEASHGHRCGETRISNKTHGVPWELRVSQLSNLDPRRVVPDFFPHQGGCGLKARFWTSRVVNVSGFGLLRFKTSGATARSFECQQAILPDTWQFLQTRRLSRSRMSYVCRLWKLALLHHT